MVENDIENASNTKEQECNGQLEACTIQKEELVEAVRKFLEAHHKNATRPLPALLQGKEVDLLKLCMQVRLHGGYDKATSTFMWPSISENLGFDRECGPLLKLVYVKYLKALESRTLITHQDNNGLHLHSPLHTSVSAVNSLASKITEQSSPNIYQGWTDGTIFFQWPSNGHKESFRETHPKRDRFSNVKVGRLMNSSVTNRWTTPMKGFMGTDSLACFLDWLKRLALNPGDPKKGQGPRGSEHNEAWVMKCVILAQKVRDVLWKRKDLASYGSSPGRQKKRRIPPSLYYKELRKPSNQIIDKLRSNQVRSMKYGFTCAVDVNTIRSGWLSPHRMLPISQYVGTVRKRIPIGSDFQVQVPSREISLKLKKTEIMKDGLPADASQLCESENMLWIENLVWPLAEFERPLNKDCVGRGRPCKCACAHPTSIECVRSHVLAEREILQMELGEAFENLGFDDMGEMVSEHWTQDEEAMYGFIVINNPLSTGNNFWDEIASAFPSKTMKELVSYYFNVFVLRRRAMENRTGPESVDSDNDESQWQIGECDIYDGSALASGTHDGSLTELYGKNKEKTGTVFNDFGLRMCSKDSIGLNKRPQKPIFSGER